MLTGLRLRLPALAVFAVGISACVALPSPLGAAAVLMPASAVLLGPLVTLSRLGRALWGIAGAVLGLLLPSLLQMPPRLHDIALLSERRSLVVLALLGLAAARCLLSMHSREGQPGELRHPPLKTESRSARSVRLTLATALFALIAAGGALAGPVYPAMAAAFAGLALVALAYQDPSRLPRFAANRRGLLALGVPAALAAAFALASAVYLPQLNEAALDRLRERFQYTTVGFSEDLTLGGMYGMLQDPRVVLRMRGRHQPTLLRGIVFSHYAAGRWYTPPERSLPSVVESSSSPPLGPGWIEIENAAKPERYFLPVDADPIKTSDGYYLRDKYRVIFTPEDSYAKRVWFRRGQVGPIMPPEPSELSVPPGLRLRLRQLLARWGALEGDESQRLHNIERHLATEYRYRLRSTSSSTPILDFLFEDKSGHCEYFATAFALLARTSGVATRVVSGYRAHERSRFGYTIVRRQHAHSWVEAWVNETWQTFDPTPAAPFGAGTGSTPFLEALRDRIATGWESLDDWLEQRSPLEFALLLVVLSGAFVVVRILKTRQGTVPAQASDPPLRSFASLTRTLQARGLRRAPSETLHHFATRVQRTAELSRPLAVEVAEAIRDYATLRYRAPGNATAVDARLREITKLL